MTTTWLFVGDPLIVLRPLVIRMTMPWIAGHLAAQTGLRWVFLLAAANFVMVAVAMRVVARRLSR